MINIMDTIRMILRLCRATLKTPSSMMFYIGIRIVDLMVSVHPPSKKWYRDRIIKRAHGAKENTDSLIKNYGSWGTFLHLVNTDFKEAYYGSINIGERLDDNLIVHVVENKKITRSCSILDFVNPDRLLVLYMGSST